MKLKKMGSMGKENNWKEKWPLNPEGLQNYSSNARVKTLQTYSFYKNTLTLDCCFSNLSLLCLTVLQPTLLAGRAKTTTWAAPPGPRGLSTLSFASSSSHHAFLPRRRLVSDSIWGSFKFERLFSW